MIYRRFGRTDLRMPVFSCGGMRYQHGADQPLDQIPDQNQQNVDDTIHRALALGINHIETARGYGSSERQLGLVLPTFPREKIIVQTKLPPREDPDQFLAYFEESLERLQLDYVDLLAIHGINNEQTLQHAIGRNGCLAAARKLQTEGRAIHIGFSTHGPRHVLLRAVNHQDNGGFDYINLHWYFIFQRNWPVIEAAKKRDMGVFIISPTDKGGRLYDPPAKLVELCKPLHPLVFNDLFCLNHHQVHTLSVGAARPSDFDKHLEALPLLDQADTLLPPIIARLRAAMKEAVGFDDPEAMGEALPEAVDAPLGLNLQVMLWLRNLVKGWDLTEYGKMRYNLLGNAGHWFPGAKPATLDELDPAELKRAVMDSPYAGQIPAALAESRELLEGDAVQRMTDSG